MIINNINCKWAQVCFNAMLEYIPEEFETAEMISKFRLIVEHIDVVGGYFHSEETDDDDVAKFYSMAGIGHKEISNYEFSLNYYFKAVAIRQRNSNERGLAAVYNNIAVVYNIKANHKLAADYNKMAIEISEKYETPPRELIIAYNNLSSIYMKSYNYDDALEWNIKASRVLTDSGLEETPISADIFLMRASIHYVHEEIDEALMLDLKALDVLKAHYPEEHADIGTAYNCVAREYYSLCKFDVAIDHYFKAQNIYEAVYGEDNSNTAAVCGNISKTYMAMEDYQNALIWCLKTLDVQKKNLGEEHPEVILRHSFASEIYEHLGLYGKAIDHLLIIHNYYAKIDHDAGITKIVSERIADNSEKLNNRSEEKKYRKMAIKSGEHDEN